MIDMPTYQYVGARGTFESGLGGNVMNGTSSRWSAIVGVIVGVAGAFALTRLMAAVLYEVGATDAQTFALVVVVLLTTALVASWLPARRALRIDPVQALRYD